MMCVGGWPTVCHQRPKGMRKRDVRDIICMSFGSYIELARGDRTHTHCIGIKASGWKLLVART